MVIIPQEEIDWKRIEKQGTFISVYPSGRVRAAVLDNGISIIYPLDSDDSYCICLHGEYVEVFENTELILSGRMAIA